MGLHSAREEKTLVKTHGWKVKAGFALVRMEGHGLGNGVRDGRA